MLYLDDVLAWHANYQRSVLNSLFQLFPCVGPYQRSRFKCVSVQGSQIYHINLGQELVSAYSFNLPAVEQLYLRRNGNVIV